MNDEAPQVPTPKVERIMIVEAEDPAKLDEIVGEQTFHQVDPDLLRMLEAAPAALVAALRTALASGQYFCSLAWRQAPQPPDDLAHFWHRERFNATDVIPALQHQARNFAAKEQAQLGRQAADTAGWS